QFWQADSRIRLTTRHSNPRWQHWPPIFLPHRKALRPPAEMIGWRAPVSYCSAHFVDAATPISWMPPLAGRGPNATFELSSFAANLNAIRASPPATMRAIQLTDFGTDQLAIMTGQSM